MSAYCECPSGDLKVAIVEEEEPSQEELVYPIGIGSVRFVLCLEMGTYYLYIFAFTDITAIISLIWLTMLYRNLNCREQIHSLITYEYITIFLRTIVNIAIVYQVTTAHAMNLLFGIVLAIPTLIKMCALVCLHRLRFREELYINCNV